MTATEDRWYVDYRGDLVEPGIGPVTRLESAEDADLFRSALDNEYARRNLPDGVELHSDGTLWALGRNIPDRWERSTPAGWYSDTPVPDRMYEVRPPQEPPTVRVPWWEALVNHEFHGKVLSQHADPEFKGRPFEANCAAWVPDEEGEPRLLLLDVDEVQWAEPRADGTVEVLA